MYGSVPGEDQRLPMEEGTEGSGLLGGGQRSQKARSGTCFLCLLLAVAPILFFLPWDSLKQVVPQTGSHPTPAGAIRGEKNFTGSQITTKRSFGYGLYVFETLPNYDKRAVVTSLGTLTPRPPPGDFEGLSKLWRWTMIDVQFAPGSAQAPVEIARCNGTFPKADCPVNHSGNANSTDLAMATREVPGRYTNDEVARAIINNVKKGQTLGKYGNISVYALKGIHNWTQLVNKTGDGGVFWNPTQWPMPAPICFAWNDTTCANRTICPDTTTCASTWFNETICNSTTENATTTYSSKMAKCNYTYETSQAQNRTGCKKVCINHNFTEWTGYVPNHLPANTTKNTTCSTVCTKRSKIVTLNTPEKKCETMMYSDQAMTHDMLCAQYTECWQNTSSVRKSANSRCVKNMTGSRENSLNVNIFRMPHGKDTVLAEGVTAGFLPHEKVDKWDVSGYVMSSPQTIQNPQFKPHVKFHTYSIEFTPDRISLYINAPAKGTNLANAYAVYNFSIEDFPDLAMMGPQMPGGNLEWTPIHGHRTDATCALGSSKMSIRMFFDEVQGGLVHDFPCTSTFVRRMAFYPINITYPPNNTDTLNGTNDTNATNGSDISNGTNRTNATKPMGPPKPAYSYPEATLDVDFSKYNSTSWWPAFQREFTADQDDGGSHSAANVDFGLAPDGRHSLILKACQKEQMQGHAVYMLAPGGWSQVVDMFTGTPLAEAKMPQFDIFPIPKFGTKVWVVVEGGKCGYSIHYDGWHLMPGQGDIQQGMQCSFMQMENEPVHIFNLPDGTQKILLTPAPHAMN